MGYAIAGRIRRLGALAVAGTCLIACAAATSRSAEADAQAASRAQAEFAIDRRPVMMVRVWNGSYGPGNALGLSPPYRRDEAGQHIEQELTRLYGRGWRRFMLHTPAGKPPESPLSDTLGEFWSRSEPWRNTMTASLRGWLDAHPDATLGVYTGLRLRDGSFPDDETLARCLQPWLDAGLTEFGFDATSPDGNREHFLRAQAWLRERGARAVMEAYPVDRERGVIEPEWLRRTPMLAITRFEGNHDPDDSWVFDPEASEVWIGVGRGGGPTLAEARDYARRGYVLLVYSIHENDRFNALRAATEAAGR